MGEVYAIASNIVSSLGLSTAAHWNAVICRKTGIKPFTDHSLSHTPFFASKLDPAQWQYIQAVTQSPTLLYPFEQMAVYSAMQAIQECAIDRNETVFILSATKGNIELLDVIPDERLLLHRSAAIIAGQLGIKAYQVISHACISGSLALICGLRLLQSGRYKNAVVVGCDRFSRFVFNGFQSFQAISDEPCKPFDAARKGITLGEAAGTIILSVNGEIPGPQILSGSTSNDANHISGPSRTGEELALAINRALLDAAIAPSEINMISAHGTATLYNDEMEAKAFGLAGLLHSHVHSFKGYTGHTLGAAGIVESAMVIESMRYQQLIPSIGYEHMGVSQPLHITIHLQSAEINYVLKTASGFGGSNAAIIWKN